MNRNIIVEKKFDQIADDYSFFNYTLNLRAQKIIKILHDANLNKSNTKILDIGVAGGELAKLYKGNQLFFPSSAQSMYRPIIQFNFLTKKG